MKTNKKKENKNINKWLYSTWTNIKPFLSWKFLISYSIPYMLVNGWAWIGVALIPVIGMNWFTTASSIWMGVLWLPFMQEKLVIIPIAIWIHTKLFKNDPKVKELLDRMYYQAKKRKGNMNYYFNNNKLIKFNNEVITIEDTDIKETFCVDDLGFKLLNSLKGKITVDTCLHIGKSKIALLNVVPPKYDTSHLWSCKIDTQYLRKALKFTANNKTRPLLNGVLITENGGLLATDSFKIYNYKYTKCTNQCVLSKQFVNEITKYDGVIELFINYNGVYTTINNIMIIGRLYNGEYPDLEKIFTMPYDTYELPSNFNDLLEIGLLMPDSIARIENSTITIKGEINEICEVLELPINIGFKLENAKLCLNSVNTSEIKVNNKLILFSNEDEIAISCQVK